MNHIIPLPSLETHIRIKSKVLRTLTAPCGLAAGPFSLQAALHMNTLVLLLFLIYQAQPFPGPLLSGCPWLLLTPCHLDHRPNVTSSGRPSSIIPTTVAPMPLPTPRQLLHGLAPSCHYLFHLKSSLILSCPSGMEVPRRQGCSAPISPPPLWSLNQHLEPRRCLVNSCYMSEFILLKWANPRVSPSQICLETHISSRPRSHLIPCTCTCTCACNHKEADTHMPNCSFLPPPSFPHPSRPAPLASSGPVVSRGTKISHEHSTSSASLKSTRCTKHLAPAFKSLAIV